MSVGENGENGRPDGISADEVALYDRQIRLWGMAAQERMRNAHVLIVSTKALANEVIKNLVLAGVGAVTLLDDQVVSEHDLGAQFLISEGDLGDSRAERAAESARKLNPRVTINTDLQSSREKSEEYFAQFDLVVACDLDLGEIIRINGACRKAKRAFYAAEIPGMSGYIFADLITHDFVIEREEVKSNGERQKVSVPQKETYSPLAEALKHDYGKTLRPKLRKKVSPLLPMTIGLLNYRQEKGKNPQPGDDSFYDFAARAASSLGLSVESLDRSAAEDYISGCDCELSAVAAIVGGVLAQDVLNVLSGREIPVQNFFIYDAHSGDGPIYKL